MPCVCGCVCALYVCICLLGALACQCQRQNAKQTAYCWKINATTILSAYTHYFVAHSVLATAALKRRLHNDAYVSKHFNAICKLKISKKYSDWSEVKYYKIYSIICRIFSNFSKICSWNLLQLFHRIATDIDGYLCSFRIWENCQLCVSDLRAVLWERESEMNNKWINKNAIAWHLIASIIYESCLPGGI